MDIKAYLQQSYYAEQSVRAKRERIRTLRELATSAVGRLEAARVSGSGERSRIESCVVEIDALEREIDIDLNTQIRKRREVERVIRAVEDPRLRTLLELRHLSGLSWAEIAERMHYSEYHVRHVLQWRALDAADAARTKLGM